MQTQTTLEAARRILTLCLGFCATTAAVEAAEAERNLTLAAIHHLENPYNLTRPGPHGELGPYQFRESTWRTYTNEPFVRALDQSVAESVAICHYEWLKGRLESCRLPPTTYNIALAWNGGVTAAIKGRASRAARDYAQRAANLAEYFERSHRTADAR